jgi:hypothetical protein
LRLGQNQADGFIDRTFGIIQRSWTRSAALTLVGKTSSPRMAIAAM